MRIKPEWALIAFLWVCYMLNHADRQVVYTLFPALQKEFGYSDVVLGMTGALFLWVYGLCSPVAGVLGDRWSTTKIVVGSVGVWSAFTFLSGLSPNGTFLLVCRALLGVSESMFMPAAYVLMANAHGPATRSRAVAIFGTSQLMGVAVGGSLSGFIAERFQWRLSFLLLGTVGMLFAIPLSRFFRNLPPHFREGTGERKIVSGAGVFLTLSRIPTLRALSFFIAVATFALYLVYTWLPTFLYDRYQLGLARAAFEASVYPQVGTLCGALTGGWLADHYAQRTRSARFWVLVVAFLGAAPAIYWIGVRGTLDMVRAAAIVFGFFAGFVSANQAAAAFEVVPASLRASTIGVVNLLGALVSGFAPFLGGMARRTIGVDRLMGFTAGIYAVAGFVLLYATLRFFDRDYDKAKAQD